MQPEAVARRTSQALQVTLRRLASLVAGTAFVAFLISAATFATGWWVFDGSVGWLVLGGALCAVPVVAALIGWALVRGAAHYAPRLINDITAFLGTPSPAADVLIDYDSGQPVAVSARSFGGLRADLQTRRTDLPALWLGVRAITMVPGLAAVTFIGMLVVGGLGTILLIGGLID